MNTHTYLPLTASPTRQFMMATIGLYARRPAKMANRGAPMGRVMATTYDMNSVSLSDVSADPYPRVGTCRRLGLRTIVAAATSAPHFSRYTIQLSRTRWSVTVRTRALFVTLSVVYMEDGVQHVCYRYACV